MSNTFLKCLRSANQAEVVEVGKKFVALDEKGQISIIYYQLLPVCKEISDAICLVDDQYLPGFSLLLLGQKGIIESLGAVLEVAESAKSSSVGKESLEFLKKFHEALHLYQQSVARATTANSIRNSGEELADKLKEHLSVLEKKSE